MAALCASSRAVLSRRSGATDSFTASEPPSIEAENPTVQDDAAKQLIHHPYRAPEGFEGLQVPVHKASTVLFPDMAAVRARDWTDKSAYTYGLHGTPTTFTLEERIAALEGGRHCLLTPSGLAAIALVNQALLAPGDELLLPTNVYGPNLEYARMELARWGVRHRSYDPLDVAGFEAMLGEHSRLVWLEAAGSVTMEFPDLPGLVAAARRHGVATALDNTWGAGLAFKAFELGIEIVAHALTKYPSGGGDVLMGSVTTRAPALHQRLQTTHKHMGLGVGGNDAELVLRSLPSLPLRYRAQDAAGRAVAAWLQARPEVARVLHPAFEGSPGHAHWRALCTDAAGLFSVLLHERYEPAQVDRFVAALRLFRIGYSWAGPTSLVMAYPLPTLRPGSALRGHLVRLAIGLEEPAALCADLEQALGVAFG
ncbi:MAG: PLP-dependent transferase [Proteobacteria bacterium]|nr:PLP-dependent transferase [Pseudomonadota bacterium]